MAKDSPTTTPKPVTPAIQKAPPKTSSSHMTSYKTVLASSKDHEENEDNEGWQEVRRKKRTTLKTFQSARGLQTFIQYKLGSWPVRTSVLDVFQHLTYAQSARQFLDVCIATIKAIP